jgi:hypothetical protein
MKTNLTSALPVASALAVCALLACGRQSSIAADSATPAEPPSPISLTSAPPSTVTAPVPAPPSTPTSLVVQDATAETPAPVKVVLKVVKVDSEETAGENGKGANAVDGDRNTIWHTQWQDATPECPHEIVIELTPPSTIKGFTYLPRQDDSENGTIKDYEFYVSNDGADFGQPVAKGTFESGKGLKSVTLAPQACHFIKLKALSEVNGEAWTSAAEISVTQ